MQESSNPFKSSQVNIESFNSFLEELNIQSLSKTTRPVMFLLSMEEFMPNDLVLADDFNLFKDLLVCTTPYEVRKGIHGTVTDAGFSFKFKKTSLTKEELKSLIPECISGMNFTLDNISNEGIRLVHAGSLSNVLNNYSKLKVSS